MYKGVIGRNELDDFWDMLSPEEQEIVTQCYVERYTEDMPCILDHMDGTYEEERWHIEAKSLIEDEDGIGAKKYFFLEGLCLAVLDKDLKLFDKISDYVLKMSIDLNSDDDVTDAHLMYQGIAKGLYSVREKYEFALELCIVYCKKDIEFFDYYTRAFTKKWGENPLIETVKRLTIIYEKTGKYDEAIKYCQFALDNGLKDGTKGGYQGRMEKLLKKKNNA